MAMNITKILNVVSKWPVDPKRKTRCYGSFLRKLIEQKNPTGDIFPGDPKEASKKLSSLNRLAEDKYVSKFIPKGIGASGLKKEEINIILSDEFIEYFNSKNTFSNFIKSKFSSSTS